MLVLGSILAFLIFPNEGWSAATCPRNAEQLRKLSDLEIHSICTSRFKPIVLPPDDQRKAPELPRTFQNVLYVVNLCESAIAQGEENSNVVEATKGRQAGFKYEAAQNLDQKKAMDESTHLLMGLHNYTNISMLALYRAQIKFKVVEGEIRRAQNFNKEELDRTNKDLSHAKANVDALRDRGDNKHSQQYLNENVPVYEKLVKATEQTQIVLDEALDCLKINEKPIAEQFESWSKIKKALLGMNFEKLVPKDASNDPDVQSHIEFTAKAMQEKQADVYNVLNDIGERDVVFQAAGECGTKNCSKWIKWVLKAISKVKIISYVSQPLRRATSTITGSLAGYKAYRQGLHFWEAVKEAVVEFAPLPEAIGKKILLTEIGQIEEGTAVPFTP